MLCINRSDIYICLHIHSKLFMKKSTAPEVTKFDRCAVTMSDFCFILMGFCRVGSRAYSVPDINTCTAKGGKPKWGTKFFYTVLELWCKAIIWTNHYKCCFPQFKFSWSIKLIKMLIDTLSIMTKFTDTFLWKKSHDVHLWLKHMTVAVMTTIDESTNSLQKFPSIGISNILYVLWQKCAVVCSYVLKFVVRNCEK